MCVHQFSENQLLEIYQNEGPKSISSNQKVSVGNILFLSLLINWSNCPIYGLVTLSFQRQFRSGLNDLKLTHYLEVLLIHFLKL